MFARVSTFQGLPATINESIKFATEKSIPAARSIPGFKGVYFLADRSSGKMLAVTLWESEAALKESEEEANRIRSEGAAATSEEILSVERFEVVLQDLV